MPRTAMSLLLLVLVGCTGQTATESSDTDQAPSRAASAAPSLSTSPATTGPVLPESSPARTPVPDVESGAGVGTENFSVTRLDPAEAAQQAELDPAGGVDGLRFFDGAGTNLVLLRRRENAQGGASLLADHVVYPNSRERIVLREVRDGVTECDLDMVAEFAPQSLSVADVDGDSLGEVSLTYRLNCAGDISPGEQKLLVLEGGEKYILRGSPYSPYTSFEDPKPEPPSEAWPASTYDPALVQFRELARR